MIVRQVVISCDIEKCDAEVVRPHAEEIDPVTDGWIILRNDSTGVWMPGGLVAICPLHNIKLKERK